MKIPVHIKSGLLAPVSNFDEVTRFRNLNLWPIIGTLQLAVVTAAHELDLSVGLDPDGKMTYIIEGSRPHRISSSRMFMEAISTSPAIAQAAKDARHDMEMTRSLCEIAIKHVAEADKRATEISVARLLEDILALDPSLNIRREVPTPIPALLELIPSDEQEEALDCLERESLAMAKILLDAVRPGEPGGNPLFAFQAHFLWCDARTLPVDGVRRIDRRALDNSRYSVLRMQGSLARAIHLSLTCFQGGALIDVDGIARRAMRAHWPGWPGE